MFSNEPLTDFSLAPNRATFAQAVTSVQRDIEAKKFFGRPIINGSEISSSNRVASLNPSNPETPVGQVEFATEEQAKLALASVHAGAKSWRTTPAAERCRIIQKAGSLMRERKLFLAALMVHEGGKPWREADADVAEAIDFCDYYADEMLRLGQPRLTDNVPGEENWYHYQARGTVLVISPWNFPLAIAAGMTVAALVTGNSVILKPAEQTSLIAYEFAKILLQAGVPPNAFAFLPGAGEVIGRYMVKDPLIDLICFTGSTSVGLEIRREASGFREGQIRVKRIMAEMGGKNAIVVDEDADLDEAIKGIIYSAFGYAGQKCSACSRVIFVGDGYDSFMGRLCDAAGDIISGPASHPATLLSPVIDLESQSRILNLISDAQKTQALAFKSNVPAHGYFVPATIFRDVDVKHTIWRDEIFGPVLACRQAKSFEEALNIANDCRFALTGGVFSRSPANIEKAKAEFEVGNLYINRGITGALVRRQPFGGFKMSGIGSKAGGPDYLLQFMEPRAITENTMRRGFAPE